MFIASCLFPYSALVVILMVIGSYLFNHYSLTGNVANGITDKTRIDAMAMEKHRWQKKCGHTGGRIVEHITRSSTKPNPNSYQPMVGPMQYTCMQYWYT